jgi:hypothetical protein
MPPSWRKHFDELVNGTQMLPPRSQFFGQVVEKVALFKDVGFHQPLTQRAFERVLDVMQVKLDKHLNFVPVEKWRDFCMPFAAGDLFKSDFRDGQAKRFVSVLRNSMLVGVLWNHDLILD